VNDQGQLVQEFGYPYLPPGLRFETGQKVGTPGQKEREAFQEQQQARQFQQQREQQQRSFAEREKLSATMRNAATNAVAVNSAVTAVDTILDNGDVLRNLLSAAKIDLVIDPQGRMQSLVARGVSLNPQEAAVATAFAALTEHINLLRAPLGATGFRGPEAFARLQAQRGNPLANPAVTLGILRYTRDNLLKMQRANIRVLGQENYDRMIAPPGEEGGEQLDLKPE
jgi:hypothetical protein